MQRCLSAPMCAIVTREPESDILRPHWPAGSNGFPTWQRELVIAAKHVIDSRESWRGCWASQGGVEGMVIPIERENEILGALAIVRGVAGGQHLQVELTLQHVGARIAGAIDSSLLFDRARHHAFVDPMTGLYNIRYFKNYLDQICETARLAATGWPGAAPARPEQPSGREAALPGACDPLPYDAIGGDPARNGDGRTGSEERPSSSRRLAEQPLTRRLVRREQTDGAPARISGPRVMNGVKMGEVTRFTLLCLDLNNFKPVNDRFGHLEGDRVLRDIADRLRQTAPAGAVVARYGGDEFLIALPGYGAEDAADAVSRIHAGVESYNCGLPDKNGMTLRISVSIGMSVFPVDGLDSATLLSIADQRMFRAKTSRKAVRGEPVAR
jgi:diguanylate cyclase (GGDEF)-like protein